MPGVITPKRLSYFHLVSTWVWGLLLIPSLLWWKDAIFWVVLMSWWANFETSFGAYQASRAERRADREDDFV